ncbi:MAG TPA: molybdopterin-binding protein [Coriobacteriia bacterium]
MTTPDAARPTRIIRTAVLLAIGSELTTGETRDTNGGELARALAGSGVQVRRILALPDDLAAVTTAFREAMTSVDLVVATGGIGPPPDDLTREALAAAVGEVPVVDPELEAWLRDLFARRGIPLLDVNLKQAWRIPSATAIPNPNGTAPGWWLDRPDGRVAVLLPGPPREMRAMWSDWVLLRLRERRLGDGRVVRTLRTYGIGESQVAELLGDAMLRRANPVVATYARTDWLDVRISAVDESAVDGVPASTADAILEVTATRIRATLGDHVWAEGETSWADLVSSAASAVGVRLATVEVGTTGTLGALLAEVPALERSASAGPGLAPDPAAWPVEEAAVEAARSIGVAVGVAVGVALVALTVPGEGTRLRVAVAAPEAGVSRVLELRLFQHGAHGRFRAAVAAAAFMVEVLRELGPAASAR